MQVFDSQSFPYPTNQLSEAEKIDKQFAKQLSEAEKIDKQFASDQSSGETTITNSSETLSSKCRTVESTSRAAPLTKKRGRMTQVINRTKCTTEIYEQIVKTREKRIPFNQVCQYSNLRSIHTITADSLKRKWNWLKNKHANCTMNNCKEQETGYLCQRIAKVVKSQKNHLWTKPEDRLLLKLKAKKTPNEETRRILWKKFHKNRTSEALNTRFRLIKNRGIKFSTETATDSSETQSSEHSRSPDSTATRPTKRRRVKQPTQQIKWTVEHDKQLVNAIIENIKLNAIRQKPEFNLIQEISENSLKWKWRKLKEKHTNCPSNNCKESTTDICVKVKSIIKSRNKWTENQIVRLTELAAKKLPTKEMSKDPILKEKTLSSIRNKIQSLRTKKRIKTQSN